MPRKKKDAASLNVKLDKSINEMLEQFCSETGLSKTVATEKIFEQYFQEYFEKSEKERKLF